VRRWEETVPAAWIISKGDGSLTAVATSAAAFHQVRPLQDHYPYNSRLASNHVTSGNITGRPRVRAGQNVYGWAQVDSNHRPLACKAIESFNSVSGEILIPCIIAGKSHTIEANQYRQMTTADILSTVK
jgi:hypothetical protein